jgi:hypothetical protein
LWLVVGSDVFWETTVHEWVMKACRPHIKQPEGSATWRHWFPFWVFPEEPWDCRILSDFILPIG